ncbi:hypothetical protein [Microbulbifer discodermiae]|uniref:hypothetical protein n=1 Tax=Microbulbifer sp. 2201CG32-9 TaxID=3232309 RepID=UPI00345C44AF
MRTTHRLAAQVSARLEELHRSAAVLRTAMENLQESPKPWQSYLLEPPFAVEAANRLDVTFTAPFALAGALFAQLDHSGQSGEAGDARVTLQIPGLLAVPAGTIRKATQLNRDKEAFAGAVADYRRALGHLPSPERDRLLRDLLVAAGYPRAHLRQCYRQVLVCPRQPHAIALSWVKARKSIRKVSPQWCEKKLIQLDPTGADAGIQYQLQLLGEMQHSQYQDLRQVQVQSRPNLQVAEIFRTKSGDDYRQVGYGAMPVLVLGDDAGSLPDFTRVDHQPGAGQRRQRRDLALGREPFLPALRVFLRQTH